MKTRKPKIPRFRYLIENYIISRGTMPLMWQATLLFLLFSVANVAFLPASILFPEAANLTWGQYALLPLFPSLGELTIPPNIWAFISLGLLGAWLMVATLYLAVVTSSVYLYLTSLQRGRRAIQEREHTIILGWSQKGFTLVKELAQWNTNHKTPRVAILADRNAMKMRRELSKKLELDKRARVFMRSGSPLDFDDISLVSPDTAKTIVILPDELEKDPDISVLKTLLALVNHPRHKSETTYFNVVTELQKASNARLAHIVAGNQVTVLNTLATIARIIVQTCRQPGLSNVYAELMAFRGEEIYFQREPSLWGKTFREAVFSFENTTVIGVRKPKRNLVSVHDPEPFLRPKERDIVINPNANYVLEEGDALIVISADIHSVNLAKQRIDKIQKNCIANIAVPLKYPEKTLILGWSKNARNILYEMDAYMIKGSMVTILAPRELEEETLEHFNRELQNIKAEYRMCDTTDRNELGDAKPNQYNHVMVLSDVEMFGAEEADSRSLISLIHLRDIAQERNADYNIVSEMANPRNQELAHLAKPDDFIVGDNIVSMLLAQVAENQELNTVFEEFFDASGIEINLRPVEEYIHVEKPVNFYTVSEAALKQKQVAMGYRLLAHSQESHNNFGIHLNPNKREEVVFQTGDRVIVIIE